MNATADKALEFIVKRLAFCFCINDLKSLYKSNRLFALSTVPEIRGLFTPIHPSRQYGECG